MHPNRRPGLLGLLLLVSACAAPSLQPSSSAEPSSSAAPTSSAEPSIDAGLPRNGLFATLTIGQAFSGLVVFDPTSGGIRWQVPSADSGTLAWSPDGTRLAVVTPSEEGLTLYDARGAGILSVRAVGGVVWSPDSDTLAVNLIDGLALLPAEVGGEVQLIGPRWPANELTWSPDGASIAFSSTGMEFDPANPLVGEPPRHLYRLNLDDGVVSQLTDGPLIDHDPYFSPDGSLVIFKRTNAGTGGFEAFLTDGSGSFSSLGRVGWAGNPWSPDGEHLLLSDQQAVWIATPEGDVIQIVAQPHDTLAPIGQGWSPDGAWVLISWQATLGDRITLEAVVVGSSERRDLGSGYGASWQPVR